MREKRFEPIRFAILDPGHFHAALALKRRRPDVDPRVHVFAPEGDDLERFQMQVEAFNMRAEAPTDWILEIHSGRDWLERFRSEPAGNTAIIAGRNKPKIDLILAALESGSNVLADKPWIVDATDFPKLERARVLAESKGLVAWDMMTERHETTNRLLLALVREPVIFGAWSGTPALSLESVHCLKKTVAGAPLRRPAWWFDARVAGDSLADVGTHLVDLALLALGPAEVRVESSRRWPLLVGRADFEAITGLAGVPPELSLAGEQLDYDGNGIVDFTLGGVPVRVTTRWELDHPGGDWHEIVATGTRCTIRSDQSTDGSRNLAIRPFGDELLRSVQDWCARSQSDFPGIGAIRDADAIRLVVPDAIRRDHASLFALVVDDYARWFRDPSAVPPGDWPNRLARYRVTARAESCGAGVSPVP